MSFVLDWAFVDATIHTQPKVVHSGNLITGQNPASARPLGEELLKTLQVQAWLIIKIMCMKCQIKNIPEKRNIIGGDVLSRYKNVKGLLSLINSLAAAASYQFFQLLRRQIGGEKDGQDVMMR